MLGVWQEVFKLPDRDAVNYKELQEAYFTLARYMAYNCFPRSGSCKKCPFCLDRFVCLIQRMGIYPQMAGDTDAKGAILRNVYQLENESNSTK